MLESGDGHSALMVVGPSEEMRGRIIVGVLASSDAALAAALLHAGANLPRFVAFLHVPSLTRISPLWHRNQGVSREPGESEGRPPLELGDALGLTDHFLYVFKRL